jgi:hypothetical protein
VSLEGGIQLEDKYGVVLSGIASEGKVLASLCASYGSREDKPLQSLSPLIVIACDRLTQKWSLPSNDLEVLKQALSFHEQVQVTDGALYVPVDEKFTRAMADQLLGALVTLDEALGHVSESEPLPDLKVTWGLNIEVSDATQRSIHALLRACPPHVVEIYVFLIQGWHDAGERMYSTKTDRLYLRLSVRDHTFALATLYGAQHRHGARIELRYPLTYYLDAYPRARRHYEQVIGRISGFRVHNTGARIPMVEAFERDETERLLEAMCRLAEDVRVEAESG